MTVTLTDIIIIVAIVFVVKWVAQFIWATLNFFADKWLRHGGWDEEEDFVPMRDYTPVWCLFTGTDHLVIRSWRKKV